MNEGIRLYRKQKYEEALQEFLKGEVAPDEYSELSYYLGLCYVRLGMYDDAMVYFEQVISSDAGFAQVFQVRMLVGYVYTITNRLRLAEFEFTRLIEDGYESPKVHAALAYTFFVQKKTAAAIASLEKALALDPENANAMNSLGFIMAENNLRLGLALNYCKRAVAKQPKNAAYLDSLGWTHYKCGNLKEARDFLQRAAKFAPKNPEVQEHLRVVFGGIVPAPAPTARSRV